MNFFLKKIWHTNNHNENEIKRFDFLDGYRGLLAIIVLISHSKSSDKCELLNYIESISHSVGVYGFFVLSAFLLTYKLLHQLNSKPDRKTRLWIITKYIVRRFFRIYFVFFIVATGIKFGPKVIGGRFNSNTQYYYRPWSDIVLLNSPGINHLWTISPEFKYYFFIPIFCLSYLSFKKYGFIFLIMCILFSIFNEIYNFFNLRPIDFYADTTHLFKVRFSIFFYGSIGGLLIFKIEKYDKIIKKLDSKFIQASLNIITIILAIYGLKFIDTDFIKEASTSGRVWSSLIVFLVLSNQNSTLVRFFNNQCLRTCGNYSFGIYLLHPIFIQTTFDYFNFKMQIDNIVIVFIKSFIGGYLFNHLIESNCIELGNVVIKRLERKFFKENFIEKLLLNKENIV